MCESCQGENKVHKRSGLFGLVGFCEMLPHWSVFLTIALVVGLTFSSLDALFLPVKGSWGYGYSGTVEPLSYRDSPFDNQDRVNLFLSEAHAAASWRLIDDLSRLFKNCVRYKSLEVRTNKAMNSSEAILLRWCHDIGFVYVSYVERNYSDDDNAAQDEERKDELNDSFYSEQFRLLNHAPFLGLVDDLSKAPASDTALRYKFYGKNRCSGSDEFERVEIVLLCCPESKSFKRGDRDSMPIEDLATPRRTSIDSRCLLTLYICSPAVCWADDYKKSLTSASKTLNVDLLGKRLFIVEEEASSTCSSGVNSTAEENAAGEISPEFDKAKLLSETEKNEVLEQLIDMFNHGYESYLQFAFPMDEIQSQSCVGKDFELTAGNMLTAIDSLDMLVIIGNYEEFGRAVVRIKEMSNFDLDVCVSVFETTIRILGGLISGHLLASDEELGVLPDYDDGLLPIIVDLANRLLPAFDTPTSIPYGTVNLRSGVMKDETTVACTSAAGSLSLEFGMVSILTNDPKYGLAAKNALRSIYTHRSSLGLVGRHIDIETGTWTEPSSGIGSNVDSLYEYYLKHYILFGDEESFDMFFDLYKAVLRHLRVSKTWYRDANIHSATTDRLLFNSLMSFWPGLQTLQGDMASATTTLNAFLKIWNRFGSLPEDFDLLTGTLDFGKPQNFYPLRPELMESVFYVSASLKDSSWSVAARDMIKSINETCRVDCGFASIKDVGTKELSDNMPSFFLAEFLKYAYLIFNETSFLRDDSGGNYVFTTEGHPFPVRGIYQNAAKRMGFASDSVPNRTGVREEDDESPAVWGCDSLHAEMYKNRQCPALGLSTWEVPSDYISGYYRVNS